MELNRNAKESGHLVANTNAVPQCRVTEQAVDCLSGRATAAHAPA